MNTWYDMKWGVKFYDTQKRCWCWAFAFIDFKLFDTFVTADAVFFRTREEARLWKRLAKVTQSNGSRFVKYTVVAVTITEPEACC